MVYIEAFFAILISALPVLFFVFFVIFLCSKSFRNYIIGKIAAGLRNLFARIKNSKGEKTQETINTDIPKPVAKALEYPPRKPNSGYTLKYSYEDVKLAKTETCNTSVAEIGAECGLYHEYKNEYDNKAVAVFLDDVKIGYFFKGKLQEMYIDYTDYDGLVTAVVSKIENGDIYVNLAYYKERDIIKEFEAEHETKLFKLTNTASADTQEMIMLSSVGDPIYYNWDFDKEKYTSDVGCFPNSANQYLENDVEAYVYEIGENDDGKYIITAIVQID